MKVDRRYYPDLDSLIRNNEIRLSPGDLDSFINKNMYFKRLQHQNGFDSIDDMVDNLRKVKPVFRSKYVDFI